MNEVFGYRPHVIKHIQERATEFSEEQTDTWYQGVHKSYPYPGYDEDIKLIRGNVAMCAGYGELNHAWMENMYNDMFDTNKIIVIGKLMHKRGCLNTMNDTFSTCMTVVRHILKQTG